MKNWSPSHQGRAPECSQPKAYCAPLYVVHKYMYLPYRPVRFARVEDYRARVATLSLNFFYFLLPLGYTRPLLGGVTCSFNTTFLVRSSYTSHKTQSRQPTVKRRPKGAPGPYQTPSPSEASRIRVVRLPGGGRRAICTNSAPTSIISPRLLPRAFARLSGA
eukprot:COSAG02_NODE_1643_length_11528_cov_19.259865_3_plen_162_part_00